MEVNRLLEEEETNAKMADDRLTDLPESLQLHILSSLETRYAIRTSMISKSWVSSWTRVPILNFSSYGFAYLSDFDTFVIKTISLRQSVKLDKLIFKRGGICSISILKQVFDYAFSHGVRELEANIKLSTASTQYWPIWSHNSSDSLTSLKLESNYFMGFSLRSGIFKNLTNLHLRRVTIEDLDPFSGFEALEKLTLLHCPVNTNGHVLNVHSLQLSELTIVYNRVYYLNHCELATPNLRRFEYRGTNFSITTHQGGLPVLDMVILDYTCYCFPKQEKIMFDDLMKLFDSFHNVKLFTVSSSVCHLLWCFPEELVNRSSPFGNLKCLNVDFGLLLNQNSYGGPCELLGEYLKLIPRVKGYLLQKSPDAECNMIYPYDSRARRSL